MLVFNALKPLRLEDWAARATMDLLTRGRAMRAFEASDNILKKNEHRSTDDFLPQSLVVEHFSLLPGLQGILTYESRIRWAYADLHKLRCMVRNQLGTKMTGGAWVPFRRQLSRATEDAMCFKKKTMLIPWLLQLLFDDTLLILGYQKGLPIALWRLQRHVERMKFNFDQLTDLSTDVMSGLSKILIPVITRAPNLRHMYLMDDPISANDLITIGQTCKNLEILRLSVSATAARRESHLSEMPYTSDDLCKTFFSGRTMKQVQKAYVKLRDVEVSMPKLRHLFIAYMDSCQKWDFFKLVIHYYENIEEILSYYVDLEIPYFEDVICHNAILAQGRMKLTVVELHSRDLLLPELEQGLLALPKLKALRIFVDFDAYQGGRDHFLLSVKAGMYLKEVMEKLPNVTQLFVRGEYNTSEEDIQAVIFPTLKKVGFRIKIFTITSCMFGPIRLDTCYQLINMCTNLESLRLSFGYLTKKHCSRVTTKLNPMKKLNFLLVQDLTQDTPLLANGFGNNRPRGSAIGLLKDLVAVAPNIQTMFVSVDWIMSKVLLKVLNLTKVRVLYIIHSKDDTNPPPKTEDETYFNRLISKFPLLKRVALKSTDMATVRKVQEQYCNSSLTVENGPYDPRDPIWHGIF